MYARKREYMENMVIEDMVSRALKRTITSLRRIYNGGKGIDPKYERVRIAFPKYENTQKTRVSEQELRFVFAEKLSSILKKEKNYYYSIETPTKDDYTFSNGHGEKIDPITGRGQSGNFDMTILDGDRRKKCLIEFKEGSVSKQAFMEVLAKLANPKEEDADALRYLIHIVESERSVQCGTNLEEAMLWMSNAEGMQHPCKEVKYRCFSLNPKERIIKKTINEQNIITMLNDLHSM